MEILIKKKYLFILVMVKSNYLSKIIYTLVCIFYFFFLYSICNDIEFSGWVNTNYMDYTDVQFRRYYIFQKYVKENRKFITREEFLKIPVMKDGNSLYFIGPIQDKDNYKFYQIQLANSTKSFLFDLYDKNGNGLLSLSQFLKIPIKTDKIKYIKLNSKDKLILQNRIIQGAKVTSLFDRLYFSFITQTTLGYGDIFPASRRVKTIAMTQALSTIFIILF